MHAPLKHECSTISKTSMELEEIIMVYIVVPTKLGHILIKI